MPVGLRPPGGEAPQQNEATDLQAERVHQEGGAELPQ